MLEAKLSAYTLFDWHL